MSTEFLTSGAEASISRRQVLQRSLQLGALAATSLGSRADAQTAGRVPASSHWRQWRGPQANGVAPGADPPVTWSEGSNVRWKVKLPGGGMGTPIVWGNLLFILTAVARQPSRGVAGGGGAPRTIQPEGPVQFTVLCMDRRTGKTVWQRVAREEVPHEGHHPDHGFASYSAVTDGKVVIASFGSRGVYCYDLQGNKKWEKQLGRMQTRNGFGEGSSPALHGNTVVINWDHEGPDFIVALDKNTGREIWRQTRDEPTSWTTPLVVEHAGKPQVVTCATQKIRSYDLATGKLIWECGGLTANAIPTPVTSNGMLYATSGFRGSALLAIRLGRTGDLTGTDAIAWSLNRGTPYVPSPLLYDHRLYYFGSNSPILSCVDARSGKLLMDGQRVDALQGVYSSPVGAAGRVYLVGRGGAVAVIRNSDRYELLATNQLEEKFDASPALVGKDLYLRGHEHLYCLAAG